MVEALLAEPFNQKKKAQAKNQSMDFGYMLDHEMLLQHEGQICYRWVMIKLERFTN